MAGCSHIYGGAAVGFETVGADCSTAPWRCPRNKPAAIERRRIMHSIVSRVRQAPSGARLDLYVPRVLGCNVCKLVA